VPGIVPRGRPETLIAYQDRLIYAVYLVTQLSDGFPIDMGSDDEATLRADVEKVMRDIGARNLDEGVTGTEAADDEIARGVRDTAARINAILGKYMNFDR
jgi:hypothetical protein